MKTCIACGMPMEGTCDFAMGDQNKDYCVHCAREDGSMKSYDETLEYSIKWAREGENYKIIGFEKCPTEDEARKSIIGYMATLPAWKDR